MNDYNPVSDAFGEWKAPDFSKRLKIRESPIVVVADAHVPYIRRDGLEKLRQVIHEQGIKVVCWLGDFMDMHRFSTKYPQTDYSLTWEREKEIASAILVQIQDDLSAYNGYQVVVKGNHDNRWIKTLKSQESIRGLLCSLSPLVGQLVGDGLIVPSESQAVEAIQGNDGLMKWLLVHPNETKAPFQTPGQLALFEQKHILSAHAHQMGIARDPSGRYWVVEGGGLFDANAMQYVQESTHPKPANGFWILKSTFAPEMVFLSDSPSSSTDEMVELSPACKDTEKIIKQL